MANPPLEIVIFDTETTGLSPASGDRIVELAAIRFEGQSKKSAFHSLVNPARPISWPAFQVNHITEDMLREAPPICEVIPEFLRFIQGGLVCSYNAGFDWGFLENELILAGFPPLKDVLVVDILKMARSILVGLDSYSLSSVAQYLGIAKPQRHRALADVELTAEVFFILQDMLTRKGICQPNALFTLFGISNQALEDASSQKVSLIQEALDLGGRLKIRYFSRLNTSISEREVIPKKIVQEGKRLYLVGHCLLRNEERSFRLDNIVDMELV